MADPVVILTISPHITVEYDLANRPNNKCTFPATDANVASLQSQLATQITKSDAMKVLAAS